MNYLVSIGLLMPAKITLLSILVVGNLQSKTYSLLFGYRTGKWSSASIIKNNHADKKSKQTGAHLDIGQYNPSQFIATDIVGHWPYVAYPRPYPGYGHSPPSPHTSFGLGFMMQPTWETKILSEIKIIKDKMKSIDLIEKTINAANVSDLEIQVKHMDSRVQHSLTCAQFLGWKFHENSKGRSNVNINIKHRSK